MPDPSNQDPTPPERPTPDDPTGPVVNAPEGERPPYDANIQLIRRRLADENRRPKPKRWWGLR